MTWPAIGHWLGILSVGEFLRRLMDTLCCRSLLGVFDGILDKLSADSAAAGLESGEFVTRGIFSVVMPDNSSADSKHTLSFANALSLASADLATQFRFTGFSHNINNLSRILEGVIARGDQPLEIGAVLNSVSPRFKLPANDQALNSVEA